MDYQSLLNIFTHYFQYNFSIKINNIIVKEGKIIFVSLKDFNIKFNYIDKKRNKMKLFEFPLPFDFIFKKDENKLILDYTINTFCNKNYDLLLDIKKIDDKKNYHQFYNKLITITFF